MTKYLRLLFVSLLILGNLSYLFSQDNDTEKRYVAKPIVLVFADIYSGLNKGNNPSGINVQRAYFGYDIQLEKGFSTKVVLDIGNPGAIQLRRYAYFKNAYLQYTTGKFNFKFGIIPMQLFKVQEKVWGHRYVEKSAADKYRFGTSADIGISANYKLTGYAEFDFTISNGEGDAEIQSDNTYKTAVGLTLKPYKGLILRTYADLLSKSSNQMTFVGFIGYKIDNKFALGLEYDKQLNVENVPDNDLNIFSATASYFINDKFQVFSRYDIFNSNTLDNDAQEWNLAKSGKAQILGIQFSPISNIRMAINYRNWVSNDSELENESFIYLNIQFGL